MTVMFRRSNSDAPSSEQRGGQQPKQSTVTAVATVYKQIETRNQPATQRQETSTFQLTGSLQRQCYTVCVKLQINVSKTKELVFRRPSARHFTTP